MDATHDSEVFAASWLGRDVIASAGISTAVNRASGSRGRATVEISSGLSTSWTTPSAPTGMWHLAEPSRNGRSGYRDQHLFFRALIPCAERRTARGLDPSTWPERQPGVRGGGRAEHVAAAARIAGPQLALASVTPQSTHSAAFTPSVRSSSADDPGDQRDSAPGARWLASGYLQPVENVRDGDHKEQAGVPGGPAAPVAHAVLVEGRPDGRVVLAGIGQHLRNRLRAAAVERAGPPARRVVSTAGGPAGVRRRRVQPPIVSLRLASSSGDTSSTWVATAQ